MPGSDRGQVKRDRRKTVGWAAFDQNCGMHNGQRTRTRLASHLFWEVQVPGKSE